MCAHCPSDSLSFRVLPGTDKECVLCIFHKGTGVATRLIVSFLDALQVGIEATSARKRLRQVKAYLTVLSIQPGGELRDQTVCPPPGLVTMPSRLPFLNESALSFPPPTNLLVGHSPGPAQRYSTSTALHRSAFDLFINNAIKTKKRILKQKFRTIDDFVKRYFTVLLNKETSFFLTFQNQFAWNVGK